MMKCSLAASTWLSSLMMMTVWIIVICNKNKNYILIVMIIIWFTITKTKTKFMMKLREKYIQEMLITVVFKSVVSLFAF